MYTPSLDDVLLEPFSVFIKLAVMSFKEPGTKISFGDNSIHIANPGLFQGVRRFISRVNREHISYLSKPIKRVIVMYPPTDSDNILYLYRLVIKGIEVLKQSYNHKSSTILHSLDLYIHILNKSIKTGKIPDEEIHIPEKLQGLWKEDEINVICLLFKECEAKKGDIHYINSIDCILKSKEDAINEAISHII
tara:strand:+ start:2389 stop:2964 length:576 start_codon:yes stop_codon:yes gene_type:complete